MENFYTCKYFKIKELVPYDIYINHKHEAWKLWMALDIRSLLTADMIRELVDTSIIINSRNYGGKQFDNSGMRLKNSNVGAKFSQHKFGRANDLKFHSEDWTPEKLRLYMKKIGCFEEGFRKKFTIPFLNLKNFNKKNSLIEYIFNQLDQQVPIEFIPFIFMTRIEWKYYNDPKNEMSWFHYDIGNSISSKIEIIFIQKYQGV